MFMNILTLLLLACCPTSPADLQQKWKEQRTEIKTADIRLRLYRSGDVAKQALSRDQVNTILDEVDLVSTPERLADLVEKLTGKRRDPAWGVLRIKIDGENMREDNLSGGDAQIVFNNTKIIFDPANRQVILSSPGAPKRGQLQVADLRLVPSLPKDAKVDAGNDEISVVSKRLEYRIDKTTGLMKRRLDRDADGNLVREIVQLGETSDPNGILFPTVKVEASYNKGQCRSINISIIEEMEFNKQLPENAFALAVGPGAVVIDERVDNNIKTHRFRNAESDVLEFLNKRQ
jgi:hypothetical protein